MNDYFKTDEDQLERIGWELVYTGGNIYLSYKPHFTKDGDKVMVEVGEGGLNVFEWIEDDEYNSQGDYILTCWDENMYELKKYFTDNEIEDIKGMCKQYDEEVII